MSDRKRTDPGLRMVPQEQRIAYGLAIFSALVFLVIWTPWNGGDHIAGFVLAVMFSGALALLARQGHRLWTAFAAFLTGIFGPWGLAYIFGALFIAFAFWLGWRAHRSIKASINTDPAALLGRATPIPQKKKVEITSGRVTPKGTARRRSPKRS